VIRETLKDGLRAWVEGRGLQAQKRKADELDATERANVKTLVRRFAARKLAADHELDWVRERRKRRAAAAAAATASGAETGNPASPQRSAPLPPESRQRYWGREAEMERAKDRERRERLRHDHPGGNDAHADADSGGVGGTPGTGTGTGGEYPYYCGVCPQPTRAHVLGLKRFWEGVIRAAAAG